MAIEKRGFTYRIPSFGGGLNTKDAPFLIRDDQASFLRNVEMSSAVADFGAIRKRKGTAKLNATSDTLVTDGAGGVYSIYRAYFADGTDDILATASTKTYLWDGTAFNALGTGYTASQRWGFTTFKNLAVYGNAADATKKFNGTAEASLGGSPPNAKYFAVYKDRVCAAGNATFPNRLYICALRNVEDWTTVGDATTIDIEADDGDVITGVVTQQDRLIIFKNYSTHALYWSNPQSFQREKILNSVGCISHWSAVNADGLVIFLHGAGATNRGVYALSRNEVKLLSPDITPTIEESTSAQLADSCACAYKDCYWLFLRNGATSNNIALVLNLHTAQWGYNTGITARSCFTDNRSSTERFLIGNTTSGRVYKVDTGTDDDGAAINMQWRSKHFFFGRPEYRKSVETVEMLAKLQTSTSTLTVNFYNNGNSTAANRAWVVPASASTVTFNVKSFSPSTSQGNCNAFALDLTANTTTDMTVYAVAMHGHYEELGTDGD